MRVAVTGCAGFIGSSLTDRLLADGHEVVGIDNFVTGQRGFLEDAQANKAFRLVEADLLDQEMLVRELAGVEMVYHFAANADIRFGGDHPRRDLEQNTIVTQNVLEGMRANGVTKIAFSSTGAMYGEAAIIPTPEDVPLPVQTSLYGASKLASEGMVTAYCEIFGFQSWIYRFVSIVGERYTHGHVFDFVAQLLDDPSRLRVLGDGTQRKSYLHIADCIEAVLMGVRKADQKVNIYNLGVDHYCTVKDSVRWITSEMGLEPEIAYAGGDRGWPGDNRFAFLDIARMKALGWTPALGIEEGIRRTVRYLVANPDVIAERRKERKA